MRSKLFVPASRPEWFEKAAGSAADALSFDLQDAVVPERKTEARDELARYLRTLPASFGKLVIVRVNAVSSEWFRADLEAIALPVVNIVNLPCVEEAHDIFEAARILQGLRDEERIGLLINIETPKGLRRAAELAAAHPRAVGLQLGYLDLLGPYGIERSDPAALAHIRLHVRLAAAEAGVPAYDGAYPGIANPEGYRAECEAAHRHGFAGKTCIHPSQIAIANRIFRPMRSQIERARRILAAAAQAQALGQGACLVDGEMIDAASLAAARSVLEIVEEEGER